MYCKLTDQDLQTYKGFQWELNVWKKIAKANQVGVLCSESWLHCYDDRLLAVLFNPIHAAIANPRLFRCNVRGKKLSDPGVKFGFTQMRLMAELELPEISLTQKIAFGILCAKEVSKEEGWNRWADAWLDGSDRTKESAKTAARDAARAAGDAARAAGDVAWAADWVADREANWDSARAAYWAKTISAAPLDLKALARQAMEY